MTTPKRLTEEQLRILDLTTQKVPERGWSAESVRMLLGHVAALEQEAAAAEARGFERARAQAAQSLEALGAAHSGTMYERTCSQHAERIRAMQDGQRGGEEPGA